MKIEIYSDGSATIATKPGGWGWVLVVNGIKHSEGSGHMALATNNDAELQAAIQGLAAAFKFINEEASFGRLHSPEVTLVSDSEIVLNWASGRYRFKQQDKIQKYNQLMALMQRLNASTRWVKGHDGNEHNERCDKLANMARKQISEEKPKKARQKKSNDILLSLEKRIEALEKEVQTLKESI